MTCIVCEARNERRRTLHLSAAGDGVRVAILGMNYAPEPTGIAPYTTRMAEGLKRRGHAVSVLTAFPHYPQWEVSDDVSWRRVETVGGVSVHRLRHYVPSDPRSSVRRALSEATFGMRLLGSSWGSPDVVLCLSPALISTAMAMTRVNKRRGPAVGVIVQDLYSAGVAETRQHAGRVAEGVARLEAAVLRRADGVAVIHERFKDRLVKSFGVDPTSVAVIRNWTHVPPVTQVDRDAVRSRLGWSRDETIVLHTGAMGEKQGLTNVVVAARLAAARGTSVRFVLVGDGGQRAMLEEQAAGCRSIQFLDPLPGAEYGQALSAADLLLVNERPGVIEMAVPSKLTSYFSSGRPVLAATDPASITSAEVTAAGAGLVVPPGDPAALLEAAVRLGGDPHTCAEMGARGPAYCESHLGEAAALDAYDAWIRRLHLRRRTNELESY